jgi:hypothetical protein
VIVRISNFAAEVRQQIASKNFVRIYAMWVRIAVSTGRALMLNKYPATGQGRNF